MLDTLFTTLDNGEQAQFLAQLTEKSAEFAIAPDVITAFFDARNMPCPMPLLKAKLTLRTVNNGKGLYLVASDKNSQHDLVAFCQKNAHTVHTWQSETAGAATYHFFIIKP